MTYSIANDTLATLAVLYVMGAVLDIAMGFQIDRYTVWLYGATAFVIWRIWM